MHQKIETKAEQMSNFNLSEAFVYAKNKGNKVMKRDLAKILWNDSRERTAVANISNLCNGKTKKIDIDAVPIICKELGVTADYLFGVASTPTREGELEELRARVAELLDRWDADAKELRENL